MKKIYLFFAVSLLIVSCTKSPKADFYVEITKAKIGSEVFFINASTDATRMNGILAMAPIQKSKTLCMFIKP